ncbi:MAG: DUF5668 domain-containing protein [Vicinamibacterales bacterium]|jgi:hypothetical protein|nr:DUF5668 domain-containing protein [Vicinamibacterales bacterium]
MSGSRIAWRRVARGLSFIGFGVFCLLSTQDLLHRGFWLDALAYWPVLLIALGLHLMFERSRAPWGVLLSPLLIMATLGFVAWRGPGPLSTNWEDWENWETVQAARDPQVESWTLEATMALADLDLRAGSVAPGMLLQGRTAPANRASVRVVDRSDSSRVYLRGNRWRSGNMHLLPVTRHHWDLDVTDDQPMSLRLETAFVEGDLNLETTDVARVNLDGAFNDLTLRLGAPRTDTRVDLEGAFNHLELVVPENTPVRVSSDGFINLVDRRSNARTLDGPAYRLRPEGAFNRVVIRSQ